MADELTPVTNEPDPLEEAADAVRRAPELREAEFMRLFLAGPRRYRYNQLAAGRAAGLGTAASSDESIRVMTSRILHAPRNTLRIRRTLDRLQDDGDRQLEELSRIAYAKLSDFVTWDNTGVQVKASHELDEDQLSAVFAVVEHHDKDGNVSAVEVKLGDKLRAHEILARIKKLIGPEPSTLDGNAQFTFVINANDRSQHVHIHQNGGPQTNGGPALPPTSGEGAQ